MGQEQGQAVVTTDQLMREVVNLARQQASTAATIERRLESIDGRFEQVEGDLSRIGRALLGDLDDDGSVGLRARVAAVESAQESLRQEQAKSEARLADHKKALWGLGVSVAIALLGAVLSRVLGRA